MNGRGDAEHGGFRSASAPPGASPLQGSSMEIETLGLFPSGAPRRRAPSAWAARALVACTAERVGLALLAIAVVLLGVLVDAQRRAAGAGDGAAALAAMMGAQVPPTPANYIQARMLLASQGFNGTAPAANASAANATRPFFYPTLLNRAEGKVVMEVPEDRLGRLMLAVASVSRADGTRYLLHEPLGEDYFMLVKAPNGRDIDLVRPRLDEARALPNSTMERAFAGGGVAADWLRTFKPEDGYSNLTNPATPNSTSTFIDVTEWLLSGEGAAGGRFLEARFRNVTSFPLNLNVELDVKMPDPVPDGLKEAMEPTDGTAIGVYVSLSVLPPDEEAAVPRVADDRAGYFRTCFKALGSQGPAPGARPGLEASNQDKLVCYMHRWRLEKADPSCTWDCAPKRPIVYHIDPSVPDVWAPCIRRGVENWNRAFMDAGWANGTVVGRLPSDPEWPEDYHASDNRYSSVSWAASLKATYAIGPSNVDPRTGEIINADIMFSEKWVKYWLGAWEGEGPAGSEDHGQDHGHDHGNGHVSDDYAHVHRGPRHSSQCFHHHGHHGQGSGGAALMRAVLAANQTWPAGGSVTSPEAYVCEAMTEVSMHETGHTLGLRHNFAGSASAPLEKMLDKAFVEEHGLTASVMDYVGPVVPSDREKQGYYYTPVVGGYDRFAIKYGYILASEERERAARGEAPMEALAVVTDVRVATDPTLRFCTDDDDSRSAGTNPLCSVYDNSADPIEYFEDRVKLIAQVKQDLWNRTSSGWSDFAEAGDFNTATHLFDSLLYRSSTSIASAGMYAAKHIGGHVVSKAHFHQVEAPVRLLSRQDQLKALRFICDLLVGDALYTSASDYMRLVVHGWTYAGQTELANSELGRLAFPLIERARATKKRMLDNLFHRRRMEHVRNSAWAAQAALQAADVTKADAGGGPAGLGIPEVVSIVHGAVWGDEFMALDVKKFYALLDPALSAGAPAPLAGELKATALNAVTNLNTHSIERQSIQLTWLDKLVDVKGAGGPGGSDELVSSSRATLQNLSLQLKFLLQQQDTRDLMLPGTFNHLVAVQRTIAEANKEQ